jgi:hypothetical protein
LCSNEDKDSIPNQFKDQLSFTVLEAEDDENLENLNLDNEASNHVGNEDEFDLL